MSPLPPPQLGDELQRRAAASGSLLAAVRDDDLNTYALSFRAELRSLGAELAPLFHKVGVNGAVGRAVRLDLQTTDAETISDEALRAIAVDAHGALGSAVYIARRTTGTAAWRETRPMGWSQDGLAAPASAATLPFGGSESLGFAIEVGAPVVIYKLRLIGADDRALRAVCSAVGGPGSGFAEVGAYPIVARAHTREAFAVLECGDLKRTPLARVLRVAAIEGERHGARLGAGRLLSHLPLESVLDTLEAFTGLRAQPAQVIETHVSGLSAAGGGE